MQSDVLFVIGIILCGLSAAPLFGSLTEGRLSFRGAVMALIGEGLIAFATYERPGVYSLSTAPDAFYRVIGAVVQGGP